MSMYYCRPLNASNAFYLAKVINKIQSAKLFVAKLSGFPQVSVKRRRKAAPHTEAQPFFSFLLFYFSYFTLSTMALKASGLFMARSASTLRLISIPAFERAPINCE